MCFSLELQNDYNTIDRKNINFQICVEVCHIDLKMTSETHGLLIMFISLLKLLYEKTMR